MKCSTEKCELDAMLGGRCLAHHLEMLNALRAENRAAYDSSEAKRALTQIKGLKDISDKCEEYAPGEEIQTMRIDDRYFVSSNWRTQSDELNTETNKANVARVFETSASRVSHAVTVHAFGLVEGWPGES